MITLNGKPLIQCDKCNAVDGEQDEDYWTGTTRTVIVGEHGLCGRCHEDREFDRWNDERFSPCAEGLTGHNVAFCRCP